MAHIPLCVCLLRIILKIRTFDNGNKLLAHLRSVPWGKFGLLQWDATSGHTPDEILLIANPSSQVRGIAEKTAHELSSDMQDDKDLYERLHLDIVRRILDTLSLRERVRLTCVCKAWSTAALKDWTRVDIDYGSVTVSQSPLVLAFLNKLGTLSGDTLQTIKFPMKTTSILELPG